MFVFVVNQLFGVNRVSVFIWTAFVSVCEYGVSEAYTVDDRILNRINLPVTNIENTN